MWRAGVLHPLVTGFVAKWTEPNARAAAAQATPRAGGMGRRERTTMRYLIVGNGVAGTKAAETIRRRDPQGEIVVLSSESVPFYRRPALVEHLLGRVSQEGLLAKPEAFYQEARIDLRLQSTASELSPHDHRLTLAGGEVLEYDRLLLAVGLARSPDRFPGAELAGVVTLRALADLGTLRGAVTGARRAVVVGEGVIGLETARAFRGLGLDVAYVVEGSRFWPAVLSPDASALVEQRLQGEGVEVCTGQTVRGLEGRGGRVWAVRAASGERFHADVVGLAGELRPPLPWAQEAGLHVEDRVEVDDYLATSLPEVYAAGDAVQLPGETIAFGWLRAWHQGVVAAMNMTGGHSPYRRRTVSLSTRVFGMPILVMGDPNPPGPGVRRKRGDYPQEGVHKELVLDGSGQIVGAVMVGEVSEASWVEGLVRRRVRYDDVEEERLRRLFDLRYWATAGTEVLCPVCKFLMQLGEEDVRQGRITCPICGAEFVLRPLGNRFALEPA